MAAGNLFEALKKEKQTAGPASAAKAGSVIFCLMFDEQGAYVEVRNEKAMPTEMDYQQYKGVVRSILKSINSIKKRSDFLIDWENPGNKVYLHKNDYLIELLLNSKLWIDENGTVLQLNPGKASVRLELNPADGKKISSALKLYADETTFTALQFINETYVYTDGRITEVDTVGRNFKSISLFNTTIDADDIQKFLSLFFHTCLMFRWYTASTA